MNKPPPHEEPAQQSPAERVPSPDLPSRDFPSQGRLAAVDYGTVRIGIAICDHDRILASPLQVHQVTQPDAGGYEMDDEFFLELMKEERIAAWIVGLPIHCDGGESDKSRDARKFASWLGHTTQLPVRLFDERFTTVAANQRIRQSKTTRKKTKQRIDAVAAQVLLEAFMEAIHYREDLPGHPIDEMPAKDSLAD